MLLSIGNVASGDKYFERPHLDEKFWRILAKSQHVNIAAPRRIGKTSFMTNLSSKGKQGYKVLYIITESINDNNEFFKKIYKELLTILSASNKFKEAVELIYKRLEIKKISTSGMEFGKSEIDFFEEIKDIMKKTRENDEHIVLMIDEYSQTIENIILDKGESEAKHFLHQCRELRIDPSCIGKISFVYTGSVGLENLVASLNESKSITDIARIEMPALTQDEALQLIEKILNNEGYDFEATDRIYFLKKVRWLLPYFIQVIMSAIEEICIENNNKKIDKKVIDSAYRECLNNRSYFEHWLSRLRIMFKGKEFNCVKEILNQTSVQNEMSKSEYYDVAQKYDIEAIDTIINMLIHDGYIAKTEDQKKYRFNSPLLQEWWFQNIVN